VVYLEVSLKFSAQPSQLLNVRRLRLDRFMIIALIIQQTNYNEQL
jgi:hypothetical protein